MPSLASLVQTVRRARGMRPFDLRFELDDQLLALYNAMARQRERRYSPELKRRLADNARLRGQHAGERCWIVGNGPSLKYQDLTLLRGETVFVVNRFIHHPDAEALDPTYYCIVDPKFALGQWGSSFAADVERRLPGTTLITSLDGVEFCEREGIMAAQAKHVVQPNQQFHYGYDGPIDMTRGLPGMDNVTKVALSCAVYMGFSEINLLGIDGNGLILSSGSHFYGHEPQPTVQTDLEKALVSMSMGLRAWRALPEILAARGVRLISRNPWSALTALPQGEYPPADLAGVESQASTPPQAPPEG